MPPQSPQGDVLDRALAVARSQAPAKVPGQTGFFNALKPNNAAFAQTARVNVTKPAAQRKQQARVVPAYTPSAPNPPAKPPVDPFHSFGSTIPGPVKRVAAALGSQASPTNLVREAANPVFGNPIFGKGAALANEATTKGLAALGRINVGSQASTPGDASTSAGILNAAKGLPMASLQGERQKIIGAMAFFAKNPSYKYDVPNLGVYTQQDKTKLGLPPTATDADVIRKEYQPFTGHRDFVEETLHNLPVNALQLASAPAGLAYLGSQTARGNPDALKEFARENVAFVKSLNPLHPHTLAGTIEHNPAAVATAAFGLGRLAGGLAGTAARTGAVGDAAKAFATPTERSVVPNLGANPVTPEGVELQPKAIKRGMTSPKLDERVAQAVSDKLASGTQTFGKLLQKSASNAITKTSIQQRDALEREHVEPAIRAAAQLSPTEERATRFVHGQALGTPKEHAAFMQRQADAHRATTPEPGKEANWAQDQRTLDDDAKLWSKVASNRKVGDTLTPKQQDYLTKATHANRFAEQDLATMNRRGTDVPLVPSSTALRSAYAPAAAVRGIEVRDTAAMTALRDEHRASIGAPPVAPGAQLDEHDPLYNPHQVESPKAMRGLRRGDSLAMMHDNPATRFGNRRLGTEGQVRTGAMIPKGQATSSAHVYFGALAKPIRVAAALDHFKAQGATWIRDVPAGTAYDTRNWVRVRDNHNGLPNADVRTAVDTHEATAQADDAQSLRQQILGGVEPDSQPIAHIPDGGTYHLAPRASINNLESRLQGLDRGTLAKIAKTGTGLWRWTTLMARPAWLVNNVAGNALQATIAGAHPSDWVKAWKQGAGGHPVEGVENAGQFKNVFGQKPTLGNRALKPVHAFTNTVVDANVRFENMARRAVANHALRGAAKAHVHGEIGTIRSSFHFSSEAVRNAMDNPTPAMQQIAVKEVDRALGNFIRAQASPGLDLVAPFHRWYGFILKYTAELPVRTPGRALLIQQLGQLGINVQNQAFGGFTPNSLAGALQLPASLPYVGGLYKSTQGLNPLATLFQTISPTDQSSTDPGNPQAAGVLGAANPLAMALANYATGKDITFGGDDTLKDQYGNPAGAFNPAVLAHEIEGTVPFLSLLSGYNTSDTSTNPFSPQATIPGKYTQPQQNALERTIGYGLGTVKPFNPTLNQVASFKRLVPALKTEARNRAKNG